MPDPTEFLLDRITEDETIAKSAADDEHLLQSLRPIADLVALPGGEILHIVRWDPARVLAECDSKSRIVAACVPNLTAGGGYDEEAILAKLTLHLLAQPYADHPQFDASWAVE